MAIASYQPRYGLLTNQPAGSVTVVVVVLGVVVLEVVVLEVLLVKQVLLDPLMVLLVKEVL